MDPLRTQASPIIHEGRVFLMDDNLGYCFDAQNGSQHWREPMPATISSPALADGKLFVLINNGNNLAVLRPDAGGPQELGRALVRGAWCPSPAVSDGKLLVRAKDRLKCFDIARK